MRLLDIALQSALAFALLLTTMFLAAVSMGHVAFFAQARDAALWITLMAIFFMAFVLNTIGLWMMSWNAVAGRGFMWGAKMVSYWLVISIFFSMVLGLKFSVEGASLSYFFFLWPGEPVLLAIAPIYALAMGLIVVAALVITARFLTNPVTEALSYAPPHPKK